jgi:hypothetical protein
MTKSPEELLGMCFGGASVADNLRHAVENGKLIEDADGTCRLTNEHSERGNWAWVENGSPMDCKFLMKFLFLQAYNKSAVPQGCSVCYKVKVLPRTLRELVAAWGAAKGIACNSKWGVDLDNSYSQDIYAGYFFTSGLDMARMIYKLAREAFNGDPKIGPNIAMTIKRGCSDYEAALGPSDRYEFAPELAELEALLKTKFRKTERIGPPPVPMAHWIDTAFRIGDDSYLDFTGGGRLRPKMVSYDP